MEKGTYKVIRVDGTETVMNGKASIPDISRIIGCETLDTVTLGRNRQTVMFVDDTGATRRKPRKSEGYSALPRKMQARNAAPDPWGCGDC